MALTFKLTESNEFENAPQGQYVGTIHKIVDKGTQPKIFKGQHTGDARQLLISFELTDLTNPSVKTKEGTPYSIATSVNISSSGRSTFVKIIKSAFGLAEYERMLESGEEIKISDLIGKSIFLAVKHNVSGEKTYANVDNQSISQVQPGVQIPELVNEKTFLSLEAEEFKPELYESLSEKMREIIAKSPEYKACVGKNLSF